jgi:hypothetical protein
VSCGLDYGLFWTLTPREVLTVLAGAAKRRLRDHDDARVRNHELAMWISHAFHDPKKMPKFDPTPDRGGDKGARPVVNEADNARVRAWFIGRALAGRKRATAESR